MKIGLFADSYKPYISGVTVSVNTLADELERMGHTVRIFAPAYMGHSEHGPKLFRCPSLPTRYPNFRIALPFYPGIAPVIKDLDIIHSHSPFQMGWLARYFAKKYHIPYVYTFHTLFEQYAHYVPLLPARWTRGIISKLINMFCNRCSAVIVPTPKIKEYLLSKNVTKPIHVIPTGIDTVTIHAADKVAVRRRHGISDSCKVLVYVGRLTKEKNIPFLIRALAMSLKKHPTAKFLISATGPQESTYKKLAKQLGIDHQAIFAGQHAPPEVFNYYAAGDIFVFASVTETQGLVIAEAKAAGLPVVAVNAQGVADAVVDAVDGFLCPQNETAFAEKLDYLLENDFARKVMGQAARVNAEKFSARLIAEQIFAVYTSL